jgi:hypothetical protein
MTWWKGVPGLDWRDRPDSLEFANRVAALACAFRMEPPAPRGGRYNGTPTARAAGLFLGWLAKAGTDEWDAYWRRLALAFACDQPAPGTPPAQVLEVAKSIHQHLAVARRGGGNSQH